MSGASLIPHSSSLRTILATHPKSQLTLGGLLKRLRMRGRLRALVLEALTEQMVEEEARRAGLSVTREELQSAADAFRRSQGLTGAADTHAWLATHGMSVDDFQSTLEYELLAAKLLRHLTADRIEEHFAAHQAGYEQMRIAQLCVGRDDLARELACQIREEGRDLAAVAVEHGIRLAHRESYYRDLASPLAESLASAKPNELIGPIATAQGFLLVVVEDRRPAALDSSLRQHIEAELFMSSVSAQVREATISLDGMREKGSI